LANNEHVAVVRQGAAALAAWSQQHPGARLLLDWAILRGVDLREADLRGADFFGADLFQATWSGANLRFADLRLANLSGANASGADLSGVSLTEARLSGTNLKGTNLSGANLAEADLRQANCSGANIGQADLTGADLSGANLSGASLSGADLSGANLSGANLSGTDLSEARIGWTRFTAVNLATVRGLDTVHHHGPSSIGIDTLYLSVGKIPDQFLRRAGVQDSSITFAHALVSKPIDFASCFISYASRDQEFAERLYADLEASGVRCWFAPEDEQSGERVGTEMGRSVRAYDQLVLILSKYSIQSHWVETSVATALERELRQAKPGDRGSVVLFPVRLDAGAVETDQAWVHDIRRTRRIGDFTHWQDRDAYTTAFGQLLGDLISGALGGPATSP
jgi:uncharacterized protein YjbI with pentapeptide repeats